MRETTLDDSTIASNPQEIRLSHGKLRRLHPLLYANSGLLCLLGPVQQALVKRQEERLLKGDSRAAIVVSTAPLLVAAYTGELDCIAMLSFPQELVKEHRLEVGTRLLTINVYRSDLRFTELKHGLESYRRCTNFAPLIAEFVSDDLTEIEARKSKIEEWEWLRSQELAAVYLREHGSWSRDGRPLFSEQPPWLKPTVAGKIGGSIGTAVFLLGFLALAPFPLNLSHGAWIYMYRVVFAPLAAAIGWVVGQSLGNVIQHRLGHQK